MKIRYSILSFNFALTMALVLFNANSGFAQIVNMPAGTNSYAGGVPFGSTINFYDNGGSAANYTKNFTATYTFCPQTPGQVICITFTSFNTTLNDGLLYIYSGTTATGPIMNGIGSGANAVTGTYASQTADGCITITFASNGGAVAAGWAATVTANKTCGTVLGAQIETPILICPGTALNPGSTTVSVDGSGSSTTSIGAAISQWFWDWGDGTTSTTGTAITTHTYAATPGVYLINLVASDNSPANCIIPAGGCPSTNHASRTVYMLRAPSVPNQSPAVQQICKGSTATIDAQVLSSSVQTKRGDPNPPVLYLPDGSGVSYFQSVLLKSFPFGSVVTATCLPQIMVAIEHSYNNDLDMIVFAPNGQSAYLMNRNQNNPGSCLGLCAPTPTNPPSQGICSNYTFVNAGAAKSLASQPATVAVVPTDAACTGAAGQYRTGIPGGTYLACNNAAGTTTSGSTPLIGLIGAPLNGTWTIQITDNQSLDYGYICTWDIIFPGLCYGLHDTTPNLTAGNWTASGSNPAAVGLNGGTTIVPCIPTGSTCVLNDGANNLDNSNQLLEIDPYGTKITDNQSPVFNTPGLYAFNFNYSDDASPCNYQLPTNTIKVYDTPNLSGIWDSVPTPGQITYKGIPAVVNNNFTGADIGVWQYSLNGTTWQNSPTFPGVPGTTYTVHVRNSAFPACVNSIPTIVVPIELLSFTVNMDKGAALVHWETATEINNDHFEIERRNDGGIFSTIGIVQGAGNSDELLAYDFYDNMPAKGLAYYRLKQVDFDGKASYSDILPLENQQNTPSQGIQAINPNPLPKGISSLDVIYTIDKNAQAMVVVRNTIGQEIYKSNVLLYAGQNTINISLADLNLQNNMYFIQVQVGDNIDTKRFMVDGR